MKASEESKGVAGGRVRATPRRQLTRWPGWVGYAAFVWSLIYGLLGLHWALGGAGFPFGTENDPKAAAESILGGAQADTAGPQIAALGLAGAAVAVAMAHRRRSRERRIFWTAPLAFAWGVSVALLLVIPDRRVLIAVAYAPIFLTGAPSVGRRWTTSRSPCRGR